MWYRFFPAVTALETGRSAMVKKYRIRLSEQERLSLEDMIGKGKVAAYKRRHAHILVLADEAGEHGGMKDKDIAAVLLVGMRTVERVRQRCVEEGISAALERRRQKNRRKPVLDGEGEARLVAVACGSAPEGQARWTLRLLADRLVELEVVESISRETVSKVLKKMNLSPGRASAGASLPGKARNSSAPWRTC